MSYDVSATDNKASSESRAVILFLYAKSMSAAEIRREIMRGGLRPKYNESRKCKTMV
jgi:hypothetical protein